MAVDPTYPLYPTLCFIAAFFMFLILTHSLIRQSWNISVTLLCLGLFLGNLFSGINAVVWRDDSDNKLPVYCDIVTRLRLLMTYLQPMTGLMIMRKLYIISTLRDVGPPSRKTRLLDLVIEWGWGLGYPLFMTVVIYTLCQVARFGIVPGIGCQSAISVSWFSFSAASILPLIPPLISILFYFPLIIRAVYVQKRLTSDLLQSTDGSMSRASYMRILALGMTLGCFEVVIGLPIAILSLVNTLSDFGLELPAYSGWHTNHADFEPVEFPYSPLTYTAWDTFETYWGLMQSVIFAFAIFALFGMTPSARSAYWSHIVIVGKFIGWKPPLRARQSSFRPDSITFAAPAPSHTVSFAPGNTSPLPGTKSESESGPTLDALPSKPVSLVISSSRA